MHCFILAGGFATRLWPLTEKRAKPLLPLAGKPILSYLVEKVPKEIPITISTNAVFSNAFESWKKEKDRKIEILIEDTMHDDHKLGALGATAKWIEEEKIDEDILLLTGDNYFGFSLEIFLQQYRPGRTLFAGYDIGDTEKAKEFGVMVPNPNDPLLLKRTRLVLYQFEEKPLQPASTFVSTGCYVFPKIIHQEMIRFSREHPDNIGGVIKHLLNRKQEVDYVIFDEPWFDIGSFSSYLQATTSLVGQKIIRDTSTSLQATTCEGSVVIGRDSHIQNCVLRDTVIFDHCSIEDCTLESCVIDNACHLKGIDLTGKMIREGTVLQQRR